MPSRKPPSPPPRVIAKDSAELSKLAARPSARKAAPKPPAKKGPSK